MKFTVEKAPLVKMVRLLGKQTRVQQTEASEIKLFACAARVFVATSGMVAGHEALVFEGGECFVSVKDFLDIIKSCRKSKNLTIEVNIACLRLGRARISIRAYSSVTYPPVHFQKSIGSDLNVLGTNKQLDASTGPRWTAESQGEAGLSTELIWRSESESDVETARIYQLQLLLLVRKPREVSEQLRLGWQIACKLYDDGFLSFDPFPNHELNEAQEAELLLVGSIAAAGYDGSGVVGILNGLKWPYQYRPGRIYLDWTTRRWRLVPQIVPEVVFSNWLKMLVEEKDVATLEQIADDVASAHNSALEDP